jgi:hypothetical protein
MKINLQYVCILLVDLTRRKTILDILEIILLLNLPYLTNFFLVR